MEDEECGDLPGSALLSGACCDGLGCRPELLAGASGPGPRVAVAAAALLGLAPGLAQQAQGRRLAAHGPRRLQPCADAQSQRAPQA
eukprot:6873655-Alexandrium_andersonii.AAC.1